MWMRGKVASILRRLGDPVSRDEMLEKTTFLMPITPGVKPGTPEDRTCDRCRRHLEHGERMVTFTYTPMHNLIVTGGVCQACADRELIPITTTEGGESSC